MPNLKSKFLSVIAVAMIFGTSGVLAVSVQDVVNAVSYDSYRSYLGYPGDTINPLYTQAGDNRYYTSAQHDLARTNIVNHFTGLGLTTSLDPFTYSGSTYKNVVAVMPGTVHSNDIYIIGAHFDSVNCPGADDNASGVAGIMEAARVLARFDFKATLAFIAFDLEEEGLIGSAAYASAAKARGDTILGMISLDMIAYNTGGNNTAEIYGRATSNAMKLALSDAVQTYGGLTATVLGQLDCSDHASFEANGYPAALLIEADGNPYYHTVTDNVDTPNYIDYLFATNMTKGAVGYVAGVATLVPEPGTLWLLVFAAGVAGNSRRTVHSLSWLPPNPIIQPATGGSNRRSWDREAAAVTPRWITRARPRLRPCSNTAASGAQPVVRPLLTAG